MLGDADDAGESMRVVRKIENVRTQAERPVLECVVAQCGEM